MKSSCLGFLFLLIIYTISFTDSSAQVADYNTMIGVTGGTNVGGTVKQFFTAQGAADLLVYNRWQGWVGALLYEHHMDIREFEGLEWYVGGGGHYGVWKAGKGQPPWVYKSTQDYKVYGVDAIVGLEYNINRSNFYFGFYWKPAINFQDFAGFWEDDAAFTLRYSL
jgi:hypothetical protein